MGEEKLKPSIYLVWVEDRADYYIQPFLFSAHKTLKGALQAADTHMVSYKKVKSWERVKDPSRLVLWKSAQLDFEVSIEKEFLEK